MNGIYLSAEELELLCDCSPEATRLYVLGLRPAMDIKTGTVGRESRVSINGLGTVVGFYPARGSKRKPYLPNHRSIRCQLDELTRVGLTERVSTPEEQKNLMLVVRLTKAKTSENASFCPKDERQMNVTGFDAHKKQQKNLSNHPVKEFSQPSFEGMNAGHERHISENQRYKNDEMITVREEIFAPTSQPETAAERTDSLADYDRELRSAGYTHSQVLQSITQLKALKAQGATVEHLRDGIRIAKDRGGVSVAYAAKCAASICQQQQQKTMQPRSRARRMNDIPLYQAVAPAKRLMQDMPTVSSINDWGL